MRRYLSFLILTAIFAATPALSSAQPLNQRVLVVYNTTSQASLDVANYYMTQRSIPAQNLCAITPPVNDSLASLTDYVNTVQNPIRACLNAVSSSQILYIVMSYLTPYNLATGQYLYSVDSFVSDVWNDYTNQIFYPSPTMVHDYYGDAQSQGNVYQPFVSLATYRAQPGAKRLYSVWRLDGATQSIAQGLVDKALAAEAAGGPTGMACFDPLSNMTVPGTIDFGVGQGDWDLYRASTFTQQAGIPTLLDIYNTEFGTPPSSNCPGAALYSGWYSLNNYNNAFTWNTGAIGFHLDSASALDPRAGPNWSANALLQGITVTAGAVYEPYLEGLPRPGGLYRNLLEGANVGDAFMRNTRWLKWMILNIGDPLYTPFPGGLAPFNPPAPETSLALSTMSAVGGDSVTATVSLATAAPAGGVNVTLTTSDSSSATVPPSVNVAAGALTATFPVTTAAVTNVNGVPVTIGANFASGTISNTLGLYPLLGGLSVSASSVTGGQALIGTVYLNEFAPSGGTKVLLSSSFPSAQVGPSVTVPAGQSQANFLISTSSVSTDTSITISATFAGATMQVSFTILGTGGAPPTTTVSSVPAGLSLTVDGGGCTAPCAFQWTPGTIHTIAVTVSPQAGAVGTQYVFGNWSDSGSQSHSITAPSSAATYTANFTTQYFLTTAASPVAGGTIAPASAWYNSGAVVPVSATANSGYLFSGFSGALSGTSTPQNVTMTAAATVTANFTVSSGSNWYNAAWSTRRTLTINHSKVAGNLTSFPMLVSITDAGLKSLANGGNVGNSDGSDVVFTAGDGITKLNHELESYNAATGTVVAWVQIPSLSNAADSSIYLYYGNPGAANQQNKNGVWDSNYRMVNHFENASGTLLDSTQYGNNGTPSGGASFTAAGAIGGAYSFDGSSGAVTVPYNSSWNGSFSSYTVQMWIKLGTVQDYHGAAAIGGWGSGFNIWFYSDGEAVMRQDTTNNICQLGMAMPVDSAFHQLVLAYDSSISRLTAYVDGVAAQYPTSCSGPLAIPAGNLTLGGFAGSLYLQSSIDEFRISANAARSAAWIATEFANQNSPATFYSVGASETNGTPGVITTVSSVPAGLSLTVDGGGCTAPCAFQWTPGTIHTIAVTVSPQAGAVGTQYVFGNWSDSGSQSHSITAPSSAATYTANFTTQYFLTTAASPVAGGTIAPASAWYNSGAVVPVSATANSGYLFSGFSGALSGTSTPQNVTMTAAATVTANFTVSSGSNWYNAAWSTRRTLTINHSKVAGNLTSFPMLVSITDAGLKSLANGGNVGNSDGSDVVFTAGDGITKLNHELESYNAATGTVVAWVQIPSLSNAADSSIYLYYGNPGAANQQNKNGVWDSNYRMVNHFENASGTLLDSTQYGNNGTPSGGASFTAAGAIGGAYSFDGSSGAVTVPYNSSWNGSFSSYTVQMWIKLGTVQDYHGAAAIGGWGSGFNIWFYSDGEAVMRQDTTNNICQLGMAMPVDSAFHQLVLAYDSSISRLTAYVDGVAAQYPTSCSGPLAIPAGNLTLGGFAGSLYLQSSIDEFRISANAARSAAWIATEFANQNSPATFYSVGASETNGTPGVITTVSSVPAGLSLTVDGGGCTAPCAFQWTPGTIHTIAVTVSPQAGAVGTQYVFGNWSDSGSQSHSITAPSSAATYTANFTTQYFLTTAASPVAGGTIAPASAWYNSGAVVPVSATANSGYLFSGFSGALSGTSTPQNVTMTAAATVTANFTVSSGSNWYNAAWSTRRTLTINHSKVAGNLTSFPMLVSITDAGLKSLANGGNVGNSDGSDVVFTAGDGITKLNHELESYNAATGTVVAWVQIPSLSNAADSSIYLYYGNPGAANQQNKNGVWDSNYRMVNHFENASGTLLDSTQYGNNGTPSGGASFTAAGAIGGAYSFDGSSGAVTVPYNSSWNGSFSSYTVQMWIKLGTVQDYHGAAAIGGWGSGFNIWFYSDGEAVMRQDTTNNICQLGMAMPVDSAFHQLVLAYDSSISRLTAYVDGVAAQYPTSCSGPLAIPAGNLTLGGFAGSLYLQSSIDEFRISANAARSAAWIATEFANQNSPATFYSVGASETFP